MLLHTKYFGEIECPEEHLFRFERGLFGFEDEKEFGLLPFEGGEGSLLCFQSVRTPQLAFVAMNPFPLKADYAPVLRPEELKELGVERSEDLCFYTLCVVRSPVGDSTVNLRCPVAVNDRNGRAMQVILEDTSYHMRHLLSEFGSGEGGAALC